MLKDTNVSEADHEGEAVNPLHRGIPRIGAATKDNLQMTDMELDECEEATLHDVNIEEEMRRRQQQQAQEAYDEDMVISIDDIG